MSSSAQFYALLPVPKPRELQDALALHAAFSVLAALALTVPVGPVGWRLLACVAAYNVALPLVGWWRGHRWWADAWLFLFPLSALQILPDWFLSAVLGTLVFPDTGCPRVGGVVPVFMGGMWAIPLFAAVFAGVHAARRRPPGASAIAAGYAAASAIALLLFVGSEALMWRIPVWYAQNVAWVSHHVALYVVAPEVVLGAATLHAFLHTRGAGIGTRLLAAATVMTIYVGSLALSFLFIERS
jgi:hypothetical protein